MSPLAEVIEIARDAPWHVWWHTALAFIVVAALLTLWASRPRRPVSLDWEDVYEKQWEERKHQVEAILWRQVLSAWYEYQCAKDRPSLSPDFIERLRVEFETKNDYWRKFVVGQRLGE